MTRRVGLNVTMYNAVGLPTGVMNADLFCECSLVGSGAHGVPFSTKTTHTLSGGDHVAWSATVLFTEFSEGNSMLFKVMDENILTNDELIGTATVESNVFFPAGYEGTLKLDHGGAGDAYLEVKIAAFELPDLSATKAALAPTPAPVPSSIVRSTNTATTTTTTTTTTVNTDPFAAPKPPTR